MNKSKIIHCAETIKGGISTYLSELLPYQSEYYKEKIIIIIPESQKIFLDHLDNILIFTFKDSRNRLLNSIKLLLKTIKISKIYNINILHIHSTFAGITLRIWFSIFNKNIKIVYCPHGWSWDRDTSTLKKLFFIKTEKILSFFCKSIICISNSEYTSAIKKGINKNKLNIILNGVNKIPPKPSKDNFNWPAGAIKILFVGRLDHQKGADIFCKVLMSSENSFAFIAGDYVTDIQRTLSVPHNVKVLGWLSPAQLQNLYNSADIIIIPSRWEGFGLVAIEAMRSGLPVIASNIGGLSEIVEDSITGFLVQPNSPQEIINAIHKLNRKTRNSMKIMAKKRFNEHYTIDRVHKELNELYSSL